jgi:hypothetical protein
MSTDLSTLREQVDAYRQHTKMHPHDRAARQSLEHLEVQLDMAERRRAEFDRGIAANARRIEAESEARRKRQAQLDRERAARQAERDRADAEALEAKLRAEYTAAAPGPVSDYQWSKVRDDVHHQHRLRQLEAEDEARATMRRRLQF